MHSRCALFTILSLLTMAFGQEDTTYTIHFKNPWVDDSVYKDGTILVVGPPYLTTSKGERVSWHPGTPMTKEPIGDWYSMTFTTMHNPQNGKVAKFVMKVAHPPRFNQPSFFDSTGIGPEQNKSDYFDAGKIFRLDSTEPIKEVWIFLNASGEVVITEKQPDSKLLMLYNPWPVSTPLISIGGEPYIKMRMAAREVGNPYCNWFQHWFADEQEFLVHFKESLGKTLQWGKTGAGSSAPIDLRALYADVDTIYLFPERKPSPGDMLPAAPKTQTRFPKGYRGLCAYDFGFTIRDFSPETHPDFNVGLINQSLIMGLLEDTLGPDDKPVLSALGETKIKQFDWFSDSIPEKYTKCMDLPMKKTDNGYWTFDSYYETHTGVSPNPSFQFFPIDDWNPHGDPLIAEGDFPKKVGSIWLPNSTSWGNGRKGVKHNNNFCMEGDASFKYAKGQSFTFSGDDDMWIYIDNNLVIDLGWMHIPKTGVVQLDSLAAHGDWEVNSLHTFKIFYCDRNSPGSNLMMETSIYFEQTAGFYAELSVDSATGIETYAIKQSTGGQGSCSGAAIGKPAEVQPAAADIVLEHPDGKKDTLYKANPYQASGLSISEGADRIVLDKAKLGKSKSIPIGTYKLLLINRDNPDEQTTIYFALNKTSGIKDNTTPARNHITQGLLSSTQQNLFIPKALIQASDVEIVIYDLNGKKLVARTFEKMNRDVTWHWRAEIESAAKNGIYFYKIREK